MRRELIKTKAEDNELGNKNTREMKLRSTSSKGNEMGNPQRLGSNRQENRKKVQNTRSETGCIIEGVNKEMIIASLCSRCNCWVTMLYTCH